MDGVGPATFVLTVAAASVASVSVTAPDSSITLGDPAIQATVVARDAGNNILPLTGRTIVWTSSATGVATVSASGLITAVSVGTSSIDVTVDGVGPASFVLTVAPASVASVSVSAPDSSIALGDPAMQATVVARDAANNVLSLTGRTVDWTSSTTGVATVSSSGLITTTGVGNTTIGVSVDGVGPATFSLTVAPVPVATVTVSAPDSSVVEGDILQASVVARDASNNILSLTGRTIVWNSSNTGVATASPTGLITALLAGTTAIGVTVDGVGPAAFTLTVSAPAVSTVDVTPATKALIDGDVSAFSATPRDAAGQPLANRPIAWSLNNAKAFLSSLTGASTNLTAQDSGTVILSATSQGVTGTSTITITLVAIDTVVSIPPSAAPSIRLRAGPGNSSNEMFRVVTSTGKAMGRRFTVTSSDLLVATVAPVGSSLTDSAGKGEFRVTTASTATSGQTATITVTVDGKSTVWLLTIS